MTRGILLAFAVFAALIGLMACSPEPGSTAWCAEMDETPRGDWSGNEAAEYVRSCVFTGND